MTEVHCCGRNLRTPEFKEGDDPLDNGWEDWLEGIEREFRFFRITEPQDQKDALIIYGGKQIARLAKILPEIKPTENKLNVYEKLRGKLNAYFIPKINKHYARYLFLMMRPHHRENTKNYALRLREEARRCDFHDEDVRILEHLMQTTENQELVRKVTQKNWNLDETLETINVHEAADIQIKAITDERSQTYSIANVHMNGGESSSENKPSRQRKRHNKYYESFSKKDIHAHIDTVRKRRKSDVKKIYSSDKEMEREKCQYCGEHQKHLHKQECRAYGKRCYSCRKWHHFADVCLSTSVNRIDKETSERHEKKCQHNLKNIQRYDYYSETDLDNEIDILARNETINVVLTEKDD